jgi:predicted Zn-dependent protease
MKQVLISCLVVILFTQCSRVPLTGRKAVTLLPESMMQSMASGQYTSFLSQNKPMQGTSDAEMVNRVSRNIISVVEQYFTKKGQADKLSGYKWEHKLVNDNVANAWAMPGGKIVVYSGILPITQNEAGLAAVIGHEVAHAIAKHGNERMSQALIAQGIQIAGAVALEKKPEMQNLFLQSYGLGSQLGLLAFSRKQESEADEMGMIFMALAGYNPTEAVEVWKRMALKSTGQAPPEILSTHPSNQTRIAKLTKLLPKVMQYYTARK